MASLKSRIRDLASSKNLTIAELERKLDFANGSISKWDKQSPSSERLQKVADFFSVPIDSLLKKDDDPITYYRIDTDGLNDSEVNDMKKQLDTYTKFLKSQIKNNENDNL